MNSSALLWLQHLLIVWLVLLGTTVQLALLTQLHVPVALTSLTPGRDLLTVVLTVQPVWFAPQLHSRPRMVLAVLGKFSINCIIIFTLKDTCFTILFCKIWLYVTASVVFQLLLAWSIWHCADLRIEKTSVDALQNGLLIFYHNFINSFCCANFELLWGLRCETAFRKWEISYHLKTTRS